MPLPTVSQSRAIVLTAALVGLSGSASAQVRTATFEADSGYLVLEALRDDLFRFQIGQGAPVISLSVPQSIMIQPQEHPGPRRYSATALSMETADASVTVERQTLCFTVTDRRSSAALTTVCPFNPASDRRGLTLNRNRMTRVYGLGEQFLEPGNAEGDWVGRERTAGDSFGNKMVGFNGGAVGNAMFPVMYAVGPEWQNYALFLDDTYAQRWDFTGQPWTVETRSSRVRGYLLLGPDLRDLRRDYMQLVGMPPVPPKSAFGLWVSEYGYDDWNELESKLATLRSRSFPVDGFVLDLQWFGGITSGSDSTAMGSLTWDESRFPNPHDRIAALRRDHGLGVITIEESYIGRALPEHDSLARRGFLARLGRDGPPTYIDYNPWWGKGGMLDWTSDSAGAFWHDWKRQPLVEMGVVGHWTDLGEPELYDSTSWYHGVETGRHSHADVHNVYNLKWSASIFDGYQRHGVRQRPFILSRSGTSGSQRYGVAMWSGDIGANLSSLAAHMNAQMHMSMAGVDYFGSDLGGFHRGALDGDLDEMYTQWFANGALLDVPMRPHTENLCNCKETSPDRIGDRASNLANLRLRYSLTPYYYSLAHRAYRYAEPVVGPLVYHFQDDWVVGPIASQKMIGADLMVATVARHGQTERDVYLPHGQWFDFYSNERHDGRQWLRAVPLHRDGVFRLPLYARAGAIIPRMHIDERSMNALGRRSDGSVRDELIARVYPDSSPTTFTLFEDDGWSVGYRSGAVATTELNQRLNGARAQVRIAPTQGSYENAPAERAYVIELVSGTDSVRSVRLNGVRLPRFSSSAEFARATSGWLSENGVTVAKSAALPVSAGKEFEFELGTR